MRLSLANALIMFFSLSALAAIPKKIDSFPEGERLVYTRMVQSFRRSDFIDVSKQLRILKEKYPYSVFLPSSYYLLGSMQLGQEQFGEAIKSFDQVVNHYVQSGKRPQAMLGMAMAYKKLNLLEQSNSVLNRIIRQYPGSPESKRAWMELRLNKKTPTKSS